MIFSYVNFDVCRKEIARMEEARNSNSQAIRHPKEWKEESLAVLRCHAKNLEFEPVCLDAFNDARECLFRLDGQMRACEPEMNLFEECRHDPVRYAKFKKMATPGQAAPKQFFATQFGRNYFH